MCEVDFTGRRVSRRWADFSQRPGGCLVVGAGMAWLGECGAVAGPGGGDGLCPAVESMRSRVCRAPGPGAAGDAGGHMQDTVAERRNFTAWQLAVVGEADKFGPSDQICCRHDDSSQAELASKALKGRLRRPVVFGLTDPALDAGMLAVPHFQSGALAGHPVIGSVGEKSADAVAVGVGEP